jgi:short subunit dehydrogenase-like uncharacterized protein
MKNGYIKVTNVSSSVAGANSSQTHTKSVMSGQGDPGYGLTSSKRSASDITASCLNVMHGVVMISESALALLLDYDSLPSLGRRGGVLTSMSAMGDVLIERLKDTGMFQFESEVLGKEKDIKLR